MRAAVNPLCVSIAYAKHRMRHGPARSLRATERVALKDRHDELGNGNIAPDQWFFNRLLAIYGGRGSSYKTSGQRSSFALPSLNSIARKL